MQCRKVQRFNRPLKHCQVASAVSIPKYCELCVMGDYHTPGGGTMEIILPEGPRGVLTSSRLGLPCDKETKYIALIYGPWGFRKCIWQP